MALGETTAVRGKQLGNERLCESGAYGTAGDRLPQDRGSGWLLPIPQIKHRSVP